jgi:transcriptional regulator with XRE-family HTH domain
LRNSENRRSTVSTKEPYRAELAALRRGFAANVRRQREIKGCSQEDLAHDTGLHRTAIGKLEQAQSEPQLSTLLILADALGCTLNDLVKNLPIPRERRPAPKAKRGDG